MRIISYEISKNDGLYIRKRRDTLAEFDIKAADIINYDTVRTCRYNGYPYIQYMWANSGV